MIPQTDSAPAILQLTTTDLLLCREMTNEDAAFWLTKHMQRLEHEYKVGFAARGFICYEVEVRELWRHIPDEQGQPLTSMNRWLIRYAPQSERSCRDALAVVKELQSDIPKSDLLQIPRTNLKTLQSTSTAIRKNREVLDAAKEMGETEFIEHIQLNYPEQCIERPRGLYVTLPAGDMRLVEMALDEVGEKVEGASTRSAQLFVMCIDFLRERGISTD